MSKFINLEFFISLSALIISILSLIGAFKIYSRQKFDVIIQSFFNDFTLDNNLLYVLLAISSESYVNTSWFL